MGNLVIKVMSGIMVIMVSYVIYTIIRSIVRSIR